jgi:hypothetical protein
MVGSSTVELRLRPTREDDHVVAAEADPDDAPFYGGRFESLVVMSILRPEGSS